MASPVVSAPPEQIRRIDRGGGFASSSPDGDVTDQVTFGEIKAFEIPKSYMSQASRSIPTGCGSKRYLPGSVVVLAIGFDLLLRGETTGKGRLS